MKDLQAFSSSGMLWFLNRTVFLPRGYEMVLIADKGGAVTGWDLITSEDGLSLGDDVEMTHKVEALFRDLTSAVVRS